MVKDTTTSEGKAFFDELKKLAQMEVKVGFQSGEGSHSSGVDLCEIAAFNELGTQHIPARPFIRQTADSNEEGILSFMTAEVAKVAQGGTAEDALKRIGTMTKGLMQGTISSGDFTPNAPSTIKRKGSATPLLDTGAMRQGVNFQVKNRGG